MRPPTIAVPPNPDTRLQSAIPIPHNVLGYVVLAIPHKGKYVQYIHDISKYLILCLDLPIWYQLPMIHGRQDCSTTIVAVCWYVK